MKTHNIKNLKYDSFQENRMLLKELLSNSNSNFKTLIDTDIKLLSKESAKNLWLHLFGSFYDKRTRWFIEKNHWMNFVVYQQTGIIWMKDNIEIPAEIVERNFIEFFSYDRESRIFFFESEYEIIECSWKTFTTHWETFIAYNDESRIWCYGDSELLQIRPFGDIVKFKIGENSHSVLGGGMPIDKIKPI